MKRKIFTTLIVLLLGIAPTLQAKAASYLTATEGLNTTVSNYENVGYKFAMPFDGKVTITTKDLTADYADIWVYDYQGHFVIESSGIDGITLSFSGSKTDTFTIWVYGYGIVPWSLSVEPAIISGASCSSAVQALAGANKAVPTDKNYYGEWFSYTPDKSGKIAIFPEFNDEGYVQIYDSCGGNVLTSGYTYNYASNYVEILFAVNSGKTYYIYVGSYNAYLGASSFNWNLAFRPLGSSANITSFDLINYGSSLLTYVPVIDTIKNVVNARVSKSTDLSERNGIFNISTDASLSINGNEINASTSGNKIYYSDYEDFTDTLVYTVTSEDSLTIKDWKIVVKNDAVRSPGNHILSYVINNDSAVIDSLNHTIKATVNVTGLSSLYTVFSISANASLYYKGGSQLYTFNYVDYSDTVLLTLISEDSSTIQDWKVIVTIAKGMTCSDAAIASVGTNPGNGLYQQYFSFTPAQTGYFTLSASNGSSEYLVYVDSSDCSSLTTIASGWIYSGNSIAFSAEAGKTYTLVSYYLYYNALNISYGSSIPKEITYFEVYGSNGYIRAVIDTVNNTVTATVDHNTDLTNLYFYLQTANTSSRVSENGSIVVNFGNNSGSGYADFTNPVTFNIKATDSTSAAYTVTITKHAAYTGNDILAFIVNGQTGNAVIDPDARTVKVGVDTSLVKVNDLTADFLLSIEAFAKDKSGNDLNSGYSYDFTDTVVFNVYAQDSTLAVWKVIVSEGDTVLSNQANVIAYHFDVISESAVINTTDLTVTLTLPYNTDKSTLTSYFTLSNGATAKIGTVGQVSGLTTNDFTSPVHYSVIAEDGITMKDWTVNAVWAKNTANELTAFSLAGQTASIIDNVNHSVAVTVPYGTDVTKLVASFTLSYGAIAEIGSVLQVSGTTSNDFSETVTYTFVSEDGTASQDWTITVTVARNTEAVILSYTLDGQTTSAVDAVNHTISVEFASGSDVTALTATFTLSGGATAKIGSVTQVSGSTKNDFSGDVTYTIVAEDGTTTQEWVVKVTVTSTGITAIQSVKGTNVYPNPSNGTFYIVCDVNLQNAKVMVTNIAGVQVELIQVNLVKGIPQVINLNVAAGVYYLVIISENATYRKQLVIQ